MRTLLSNRSSRQTCLRFNMIDVGLRIDWKMETLARFLGALLLSTRCHLGCIDSFVAFVPPKHHAELFSKYHEADHRENRTSVSSPLETLLWNIIRIPTYDIEPHEYTACIARVDWDRPICPVRIWLLLA